MKEHDYIPALAALAMIWGGCAAGMHAPPPRPLPLGGEHAAYEAPASPRTDPEPPAMEPEGELTLDRAIELALAGNPGLRAVSWNRRCAEADAEGAKLPPNPELGMEIEQIGGRGERSGLGAAETTLLLSQELELGGKRGRRARAAALDLRLASWDYETARLDVVTETAVAYIEAFAAQERLALAGEKHDLALRIHETVAMRARSGKVPALEETKASVELSGSRISLERERRSYAAASSRLASMWGSGAPRFTSIAGVRGPVALPPPASVVDSLVSRHPSVARWDDEMLRLQSEIAAERWARMPNVTLSAGIKRTEDTGDNTVVVGLSLPLPLFDRNGWGIRRAEYRYERAREERRAAELQIRTEAVEELELLHALYTEAVLLEEEALPAARVAFDAATEGYEQGKFDFLEVLDAQRTYIEVRERRIEVLAEFGRTAAGLERLLGQRLESLSNNPDGRGRDGIHGR